METLSKPIALVSVLAFISGLGLAEVDLMDSEGLDMNGNDILNVGNLDFESSGSLDLGDSSINNIGGMQNCGSDEFVNGDGECVQETNASTECTGNNEFLAGDGSCQTVSGPNGNSNKDTNASTECSGQYEYLAGNGKCYDLGAPPKGKIEQEDSHWKKYPKLTKGSNNNQEALKCGSGEVMTGVQWYSSAEPEVNKIRCTDIEFSMQ